MPNETRSKLAAGLFLCTALSIAGVFATLGGPSFRWDAEEIAVQASTIVFLCASMLVFLKNRFGYGAGVAACVLAFPWFLSTERAIAPWNSWIFLNYEVTPYSLPIFGGGTPAEFRILHVQKRGLHFREVSVGVWHEVYVSRQNRRLFQYRSVGQCARGALWHASPALSERVHKFAQRPELRKLRTGPAKSLWSWNAEAWYIVLEDSHVLAFTTEYGTRPPEEVIALFGELEKLPAEQTACVLKDVCLGFCYDPIAALGFTMLAERERLLKSEP